MTSHSHPCLFAHQSPLLPASNPTLASWWQTLCTSPRAQRIQRSTYHLRLTRTTNTSVFSVSHAQCHSHHIRLRVQPTPLVLNALRVPTRLVSSASRTLFAQANDLHIQCPVPTAPIRSSVPPAHSSAQRIQCPKAPTCPTHVTNTPSAQRITRSLHHAPTYALCVPQAQYVLRPFDT